MKDALTAENILIENQHTNQISYVQWLLTLNIRLVKKIKARYYWHKNELFYEYLSEIILLLLPPAPPLTYDFSVIFYHF